MDADAPIVMGDVRARAIRGRGARGPEDGRIYWRAELRRRTVWTGWATRAEATAALLQLITAGVEGARPRVGDVRTLRDLLEYWVGTHLVGSQRAEGTISNQRWGAKRTAKRIGDVRLDRLTLQVLEQDVRERLRVGDSALTIRLDLGIIQRAWNWGRKLGATPDRAIEIPHVKPKNKRAKRTPPLREVRELGRWLRDNAPPWVLPVLLTQAATGARRGELAKLRWSSLLRDEGAIRLEGKTGERVVPVRDDVFEMLDSLPRTGPQVFGRAVATLEQARVYFRAGQVALGQEPWTPHGLRRLAVNTAARNGVEIGTAADMFGHSPEMMIEIYRQVSAEDRRAGMERARLGFDLDAPVVPFRKQE
jgi:integrase